jgi:hypothetical protein
LTGISEGTAKVWCIAHNGKKSAKCTVTIVTPATPQ